MIDRPNDPMSPDRPRLDPEGRPIEPTTVVNTPVERSGGMGSGWFIAGIVVVLLIIGGVFYSNSGPSGDTDAPQQATTDTAPTTDQTTTGSTTGGADQTAPAPATPKPAAPSGDASGGADTGAAPAPAK